MKNFCFASLLIILLFFPVSIVRAAQFNPGKIINDDDLTDYSSLSLADINAFLAGKAGTLKDLLTPDVDDTPRTAAEIIFNAAQTYLINPKLLLVMLQKEQSLIEDISPTQKQLDWAMGYGVCDDCSMDDERIQKFKGFAKQIDNCAGAQRWYIDNTANGWIKTSGQNYVISGQDIFIENQATANLYNYTPHIEGNRNFWKIWHNWFFQKYPDGTLLQAENEPGVWLVQNGTKRPFFSKGALLSRADPNNVIIVSRDELEQYEIGAPIKYPNYSLLRTPFGNVYMLVDDVLRKFASNEVIRSIGYNPEEFINLTLEDFSLYELGSEITMESAYPLGALLQNKQTGGVYFVRDGAKHPLIAKDILLINFPQKSVLPVAPEELDKFVEGDSIKIKDGTIVKTADNPTVYIISNGQKMPVVSGEIFEQLGYRWENVRQVDARALSNIPLGDTLNLSYKE